MSWIQNLADNARAFGKGFVGKGIPSIDDVLVTEGNLIEMKGDKVRYDPDERVVYYERDSQMYVLPVRETFHEYMDRYGDAVQMMCADGTPWLSPQERENNPRQVEEYSHALGMGGTTHVVAVYYRDTDVIEKFDSGHAGVLVARLTGIDPKGGLQMEHQISFSLHSTSSVVTYAVGGVAEIEQTWKEQQKLRELREGYIPNAGAHWSGNIVHDVGASGGVPFLIGAAAAAAITGGTWRGVADLFRDAFTAKGALHRITVPQAVTMAVAGMVVGAGAAWLGAVFGTHDGLVVPHQKGMEGKASGIVAVPITEAQATVLSCIQQGSLHTYYGQYNVLERGKQGGINCRTFAEEIMGAIGIDVRNVMERSAQNAPDLTRVEEQELAEQVGEGRRAKTRRTDRDPVSFRERLGNLASKARRRDGAIDTTAEISIESEAVPVETKARATFTERVAAAKVRVAETRGKVTKAIGDGARRIESGIAKDEVRPSYLAEYFRGGNEALRYMFVGAGQDDQGRERRQPVAVALMTTTDGSPVLTITAREGTTLQNIPGVLEEVTRRGIVVTAEPDSPPVVEFNPRTTIPARNLEAQGREGLEEGRSL